MPFANKDELQKQMPCYQEKIFVCRGFCKSNFSEIFYGRKTEKCPVLTANYFANAIFINDGKMNFTVKAYAVASAASLHIRMRY